MCFLFQPLARCSMIWQNNVQAPSQNWITNRASNLYKTNKRQLELFISGEVNHSRALSPNEVRRIVLWPRTCALAYSFCFMNVNSPCLCKFRIRNYIQCSGREISCNAQVMKY
jgi:hypothetical protein